MSENEEKPSDYQKNDLSGNHARWAGRMCTPHATRSRIVTTISEENEEASGEEFQLDADHMMTAEITKAKGCHFRRDFVPPSYEVGPRSADKAIDGKISSEATGRRRYSKRSGKHDNDNSNDDLTSSLRHLGEGEAAPPSTSVPPVARSVDILPGLLSSNGPSNVVMDDVVSTFTEGTDHSASTNRVRNTIGGDDQSIRTTSTMATHQVRNRAVTRIFQIAPYGQPTSCASLCSETEEAHFPPEDESGNYMSDNQIVLDEEGDNVNNEELHELRDKSGMCVKCGMVQTHQKEKYGIFGMMRQMIPLTNEGESYRGYCLLCHNVQDLRRFLNDPNIPLDLRRPDDADDFLRSLQTRKTDEVIDWADERGYVATVCASVRFQILMGLILLMIIGALVATSIMLTKDPLPRLPTTAPSEAPSTTFPTLSPTAYEWTAVSEISKENVDSFGCNVELSADGKILAVASPKYDNSRGRVDLYVDTGNGTSWKEISNAIMGNEPRGDLGFAMALSDDGSTICVGAPGLEQGFVQVFKVDPELGLEQKGQTIFGISPLSQFGYAVDLNSQGDRLFVGAPQHGNNIDAVYGMVQVFDFDGDQWIQVGSDIIGATHGSRFGHCISANSHGTQVAVGAPLDDEKWEDAGRMYWFKWQDEEWIDFLQNKLHGEEEGSMLGTQLASDGDGLVILAASRDDPSEEFENVGVVSVWGIDIDSFDANMIGFPIPGSHDNARFGYDLDIADRRPIIIVSGENNNETAGCVSVHIMHLGRFMQYGQELLGPELGKNDWFGKGPTVSIAKENLRVAVGYESILVNGESRPAVLIYDYYALVEYDPYDEA